MRRMWQEVTDTMNSGVNVGDMIIREVVLNQKIVHKFQVLNYFFAKR